MALGLVLSLGSGSFANIACPASRHFHPLMRPSQGQGDSGESRNPEGWGDGIVALGLVPSLGRTARSRKLHGPAYHHFHLLMRPSRGHGHSYENVPSNQP